MSPRAVNPSRHAAKRDEFVDAGQRLIQTRGYEDFSIEDLLSEVGASKGAFYHYFGSKQDLLQAVVDRLVATVMAAVGSVVADERLSATDKLKAYFGRIATIKAEQSDFVLALLRVWYSDDNAIVREKMRREALRLVTPHLALIIRQGVGEGTFTLADPEPMARVVYTTLLDMGDEAGELFLKRQAGTVDYDTVRRRINTYQTALERLLGAPTGSLQLLDEQTIQLWFDQLATKEIR